MQEQDSLDSLDIEDIPYRPEIRYEWLADFLANVSKEQPSHHAAVTKTNETKTSQSKFYDQNESVQGTVDQNEDTSTESSKPGSAISSISSATLLARFTLQLGEEQPPANSKSNLITHNGKMLIAALDRADLQAKLPRQKNHRRWVLSMLTKLKKKVDSRSKIMNELLYEDNSDLPQQRKQKKWNRDYYAKYLTENYKNDVLQNRHIEDKVLYLYSRKILIWKMSCMNSRQT